MKFGLPQHRPALHLVAFIVTFVAGCAQWKELPSVSTEDATAVSATLENSHRLLVDVEFVAAPLTALSDDQLSELWHWVDETAADASLRQKLRDNGIRIGRISNEQNFRQRLGSHEPDEDVVEQFMNQAAIASDISHGTETIPMRFGRRYELQLRQPYEGSHVALVHTDGETIGRTLSNAQYFFALSASQSDTPEQIRLRLRPEIQHGSAKQKWVSSDTAIRIDTRRETWALDMLNIDVTAAEGDTIVVAPALPMQGIAAKMLSGSGNDQEDLQLVILIRLSHVPTAADRLAARLK